MAHIKTFGGFAGLIAAASMTFTPAHAAQIAPAEAAPAGTAGITSAPSGDFDFGSVFGSSSYDEQAETSEYHRRWRGYRRYRRNRIDGGDVLAGVLILGGIAAIASAASNNDRRRDRYDNRRYRDEDRRYDDRRYDRRDDRRDDRRRSTTRSSGSGIDSAVSQCLSTIERDVRVDSVDNATRGPSGWIVSGTLFNGSGFTCTIDNNGRISDIDYGGYGAVGSATVGTAEQGGYAESDGQWSDDRYADARMAMGSQSYEGPQPVGTPPSTAALEDEPRPAYPGGPLPGEALSE